MQVSKKSLRRFIALWLGIENPTALFHQTLTFRSIETDYSRAKGLLKKLLDNIHHRFTVASLFVVGIHDNGGFHFHVLFPFFSSVSKAELEALEKAIWKTWNTLQGEKLHRGANSFVDRTIDFRDRKKTIDYFTKELSAFPCNWWGNRNRNLISKNSRKVDSAEVSNLFNSLRCASLFGKSLKFDLPINEPGILL